MISLLFQVIDLLQTNSLGSKSMAQFCEDDAVPQHLLQFSGSGEFLSQTCLNPPKSRWKSDPSAAGPTRRASWCELTSWPPPACTGTDRPHSGSSVHPSAPLSAAQLEESDTFSIYPCGCTEKANYQSSKKLYCSLKIL